jgi:DNA-directed RNA polymerase specialized sigma24 family protein
LCNNRAILFILSVEYSIQVPEQKHTEQPPPIFVTTRWSLVLAAQDKSSPDSAAALGALCYAYWYPLYAYVRGTGRSPHDAQDLTQEFFARLLANDWLRVVLPEKGRFRTFLLVTMKRFLTNEWHRHMTQKRGAGKQPLSLDTAEAEHRFAAEPPLAPDELYERRWAMTLLDESLDRLQREFARTGRGQEFDSLKEWLTAERGAIPYAQIAAATGTTEGAARMAVHRMRKQFRQLFRQTIAETVDAAGDVEAEMRYLVAVLSRA